MKSSVGDPETELVTRYYKDLEKLKSAGINLDLYLLARKEVDKVVEVRRAAAQSNVEFNVTAYNTTESTAVTQLIVATSVGIALIANAVGEFQGRSALIVSAGIALLILSLLFGWLTLNANKIFHGQIVSHYRWALEYLFSYKYKDFPDYDKKAKRRKQKDVPKDITSDRWFYAQAGCVLLGFVFVFIAMLDLWNIPSYIVSWIR